MVKLNFVDKVTCFVVVCLNHINRRKPYHFGSGMVTRLKGYRHFGLGLGAIYSGHQWRCV